MHDSVTTPRPGGREVLGPMTSTVVAASVFVATAAYLDAQWPRVEALGAPLGLWAVAGAAAGVAYLRARKAGGGSAVFSPLSGRLSRLVPGAYTFIKRVALAAGFTDRTIERVESAWIGRMDRGCASAPLLIGLDVAPALGTAIMGAPASAPVRWIDLGTSGAPAQHLPLDAVVSVRGGLLLITTRESDDSEAAWYDWSRSRPLGYSSVFPLRVDPSRVTLGDAEAAEAAPGAVAALAVAAAALSRSPWRLTLPDRLAGRRAVSAGVIGKSMSRLGEVGLDESCPESLRRPALRAASAYLSTAEGVNPEFRQSVARAAVGVLPEEPEPQIGRAHV